ncbi:tumor necrosis factor receptor superfamily member 22-like [Mastomys coucha]|uniref:tumor necrosis factor receptor superfamily member 22-like n=1 Tax=Mastomys coucha TaxID=35658 RepID=UPI001262AA9E|nr:tumor necrosis factor receptor superfamily member 22-like [Mastomys coucha]
MSLHTAMVCGSVSCLTCWFPLLLQLNMLFQVNSHNCSPDEYQSENICCKNCPAGTFAKKPCTTPGTQGQCEMCDPGTFTEKDNGLYHCIPCSSCDKNQEMVTNCSATSNQKCQCQTLHYSDPESPESCLPCTKCPQGMSVLRECNSTANTVCSPPASNPRSRLFLLLPLISVLFLAIVGYYWLRR